MPTREELRNRRALLSESQRARLEQRLRGGTGGTTPPRIPRRSRPGPAPLSFAQQRLWFLEQVQPGEAGYNTVAALRLEGPLDSSALRWSFERLLARHDSLRTVFRQDGGQPVQRVSEAASVQWEEFERTAAGRAEESIREVAREQARRPFNLSEGPLLRVAVVRCDGCHGLVVTLHHIVSDGWSIGVLVQELAEFYRAFRRQEPARLPELPLQYPDFAVWQRERLEGAALDALLGWWRERLAGTSGVLELPLDRPRPAVLAARGASCPVVLPRALTAALQELSRREGGSLFMTLLAAFQVLLHRHSGSDDVLVGSPIANRPQPELEGLIGFFANTLVFRARFERGLTFRQLLARTRDEALGAYAHQDLPFERLVEELRPDRSLSRAPLFQVAFSLQQPPVLPTLDGVRASRVDVEEEVSPFELSLLLHEEEGEVRGSLEYNTALFEPATAARFAARYLTLLEAAAARPDTRVSALPLLTPDERCELARWNDTLGAVSDASTLDALVAAQAEKTPDAPAVSMRGQVLRYAELQARAAGLATELARRCAPGSRVAVCMDRSPEQVVSLLGILRAGCVCVPLDPGSPDERLAGILADAGAVLTLAEPHRAPRLRALGPAVLELEAASAPDSPAVPSRSLPDGAAFVLYTSGSTGRPKGVIVPHRGLVSQMRWMEGAFALGPRDVGLQKGGLGFVPSLCELFAPLCTGGRVVLADPAKSYDARHLMECVVDEGVTLLEVVPSVLELLLREEGIGRCASLRHVFSGGEPLPAALARRLHEALPLARLHNFYGATEVSGSMTWWPCEPTDTGQVPVGRAIANAEAYVLDEQLEPLPPGVWGEICVGGPVVSGGYLAAPDTTALKFVPDPFSGRAGARLYRTGDLGRFRADGALEVRGRIDTQVKIRGQRIEPGEIEAVLGRHPSVREVVVMAPPAPGSGEPRLCAWFVPQGPRPTSGELRRFLKERLPSYMVPESFVALDAMPLSPNGKVDRRRLPEPAAQDGDTQAEPVAPRSPLEQRIADVWSRVLGASRVGVFDDFFSLGGHSLRAAEVVSRLRSELQVDVPITAVFEHPTIAALAASLADAAPAGTSAGPPLTRVHRDGPLPLSFAQAQTLADERAGTQNLIPLSVRLRGALDAAALERALEALVRRHEILRTTYRRGDGGDVQVIHPAPAFRMERESLADLPPDAREREVQRSADAWHGVPFDLEREVPLLRAKLLELGTTEHVLLLATHRMAYDGQSLNVLIGELAAGYEAFAAGRAPSLPEPHVQYADFASWQRARFTGELATRRLAAWTARLAEARPTRLPADLPPSDAPRPGRLALPLPGELVAALEALGTRQGATLFRVGLAALAALLARGTGQERVWIGCPSASRDHLELEGLLGRFANVLVLGVDVSGDPSANELLRRTGEAFIEARAQEVPSALLREHVFPGGVPPFTTTFNVLNQLARPLGAFEVGSIAVEALEAPPESSEYDLGFTFEPRASLELVLDYRADRFQEDTARRLASSLVALLQGFAREPERPLSSLLAGVAAPARR
ncbi:non-ribosomal peptide synthetase [Pyxidicoccus sp. MSG2]|uniref:non-ribosomal peptide synthetase n=1 Tax=Pyxidicoccus sp. MSG2 TaxID=2996790 RepID=UPI00226EE19E|nr:non-ribosomal peptide synthetase [Pyxidicoccus sp. MSG2]MCY1021696.1 amino acid adenylation domain-containing protein [Pyxidicoccus sp. MSG2]